MSAAKPYVWKDLENNHVTYGDRVRIAAIGRSLESQLAAMGEAVAVLEEFVPIFERMEKEGREFSGTANLYVFLQRAKEKLADISRPHQQNIG